MAKLTLALEEILEINKLLQKEQLSESNDFDELYFTKQQLIQQHKDKEENTETEDVTTEDTTSEEPTGEGDEGSIEGDTAEPSEDPTTDGNTVGDTEGEDKPLEETKEEDVKDKEVSTESFKSHFYTDYKSSLESLRPNLMKGFALEELSLANISRDLKDNLSTTSSSLMKVKTGLVDYCRLTYVTLNSFQERLDSARRVVVMDETLKKVQEETIQQTNPDQITEEEGKEALTKADGDLISSDNGVYTNSEFIRRLKIGDSIEFDKNIVVAVEFTEKALKAFETCLTSTISSIETLLKDPINHKGFRLILPIFSDFIKKDVEGYKSNHNLSTYAYEKVLPGDIIFISYLYDKEKHSTLDDICESEGLFGIDKRLAASVKFCSLLTDRTRATQYINQLCSLIEHNKAILKSIYDFAQDKLGVISIEINKLSLVVKKDERKQIKDINIDKLLTMIDYLNRYVLMTVVLIGDYIARVVEASLDFLRESYTEK